MIKLILIALVILLVLSALKNREAYETRAWFKLTVASFVALAVLSILFPDSTTAFANKLGVGRGADLLLYLTVLLLSWNLAENYLKFKKMEHRIAELTREIALIKVGQKRKR